MSNNLPLNLSPFGPQVATLRLTKRLSEERWWQVGDERWQVGGRFGGRLDIAYAALQCIFSVRGGRYGNLFEKLCAQEKVKKLNKEVERCIGITIGTTCHTCHRRHKQIIWQLGGEA